jgi:hypothetical protein
MPAKWQRWMPFEIDAFRGSPSVQAMHPAARAGYLYLLCSQWQTDDCSISADSLDLAEQSGLSDELWQTYGIRILRNFELMANGRLRNSVCYLAWLDAKGKYDSNHKTPEEVSKTRSENGKRGAFARWHDGKPMANDGLTETVTITNTNTPKEQVPSTAPDGAPVAKVKSKKVPDPRHTEFKEALGRYWVFKNPLIPEMPWGPAAAGQLGRLLGENPTLDLSVFQRCLNNRAKSDVNHGEPVQKWLLRVVEYANSPLDRYGKPPQEVGHGNSKADANARNLAASRELIRELRQARGDHSGTHESFPLLPAASGPQPRNAIEIHPAPRGLELGTVGDSVQPSGTGNRLLPVSGSAPQVGRMPNRRPTF